MLYYLKLFCYSRKTHCVGKYDIYFKTQQRHLKFKNVNVQNKVKYFKTSLLQHKVIVFVKKKKNKK